MAKKKDLVKNPLVILGFVAVVLLLIYAGSNYNIHALLQAITTGGPPQTNTTQRKEQTVSGLEVAKKLTTFLDKSVKPDGSFELFYACERNSCSPIYHEPHSNGENIIFYYQLYQQTNDIQYKNIADRSVAYWMKKCETEGGPIACGQNFRPFSTYYLETKDKRYLDEMIKASQAYFVDKPVTDILKSASGFKLEILYQLTGDNKYKDRLEALTKQIMAEANSDNVAQVIYKEGNYNVKYNSTTIAGTHYLATYRLTKNPVYLQAAKEVLEKGKLMEHLADLKATVNPRDQLIYTLDFLLALSEVEGDKSSVYLSQAKIVAQEMINSFWDTPQRQLFNGDYGFVDTLDKNKTTKYTVDNAWVGRLFLKLKDSKFTLPNL